MANPLTAINTVVDEQTVNILLTNMMSTQELCEIRLLSRGMYGFVVSIRLYAEETMGDLFHNQFNQFNTFRIDSNGTFTNSSYATDEKGEHSTFCCKLVPILDPPSPIQIILLKQTEQTAIQQETSTGLAFNNECNKQRQIYALTNHNLNSVCLPLFYFDIVSLFTDNIRTRFIQFIFERTGINIPVTPPGLQFGISFMPLSPNTDSTTQTKSKIPQSIAFITGETSLRILDSVLRQVHDENSLIEIFQHTPFIYPLFSVISLLMRLYSAGYCHGDMHDGNLVVCPNPSGMTTYRDRTIYFRPVVTLIDTGFAYKHGQRVPDDFLTNYESFISVITDIITRRAPKLGHNMLTHRPYNWFPKFFMAIDPAKSEVNDDRCRGIFTLFQFCERYRVNYETRQLHIFSTLHPGQIERIRAQNHQVSESVDAYIELIPAISPEAKTIAFNSHGGRRRNYYVSNRKQTNRMKTNRKQTNISKKHTTRSMHRRRKSQHRRQPRPRRHSKSKYY